MATVVPDEIAVWADELLEQGDPLGKVIAAPDDWALRKEYQDQQFPISRAKCFWKNGVIDEIHVMTSWGHDAMDEITRCRSGTRYLRALRFLTEKHQDFPTTDPTPLLVERGLPNSLRNFFFWPGHCNADLSPVYPRLTNIESFILGAPARVGTMDLPRVTSLRLLFFDVERYAELRLATLPALEKIDLYATNWTALGDVTLPGAPKLTTLELGPTTLLRAPAEPEWEALLDSPIAEEARRIRFLGSLGTPRETALVSRVNALARYERVEWRNPSP